jgi:DNA-binding LacI/PurR family transcriptional regulator
MSEVIDTYRNKAPKVAELLTRDIGQGVYAPGTMLPPDGSLAESYKVSRITMRRALSMLAETGQVVRLPNRGVLIPTGSEAMPVRGSSQRLGTKKKTVIGLSWAATPDYNLMKCLEGIEKCAAERGAELRTFCSSLNHQRTLEFLAHVDDHGVDGVIVLPYNRTEYVEVLSRLVDRRFPMVSLRKVHGLHCSVAQSEGAMATHRATHYLIEKYHRPVYYICEAISTETEPERRYGYQEAMHEAGFGLLIESHTLQGEPGVDDAGTFDQRKRTDLGYSVAMKLLSQMHEPVSILCMNDYGAQGVYEAAEKLGLTIGKDVCVVGFDGLPLAKMLKPGLTTLEIRRELVGREAVLLLERIVARPPMEPIAVEVPCELIIRGSA